MSKEIGFKLFHVKTEEFATNQIEIDENKEVGVNVGIDFGIAKESKSLACFAQFMFGYEEIPVIILKLRCEFLIEESAWDEYLSKNQKRIKFPKGFLQHLAVITVGTARGVIHSRTEETTLNNLLLPTLNVRDLITDDESFDL